MINYEKKMAEQIISENKSLIEAELEKINGVKSVSGMGLMMGVEVEKPAADIVKRCIEKGLLVLTAKTKVRLLPALNITKEEKRALLRGIADSTGYIRRSNIAFGQDGAHRVYIEIPGNWYMVIDIIFLHDTYILKHTFT